MNLKDCEDCGHAFRGEVWKYKCDSCFKGQRLKKASPAHAQKCIDEAKELLKGIK